MIKEIKYGGYTANTSDYECTDGELAMSANLINEEGVLRPVQPATELFSLTGMDVIKVHEHVNGFKHFIIVYNDNNLVKFNWCQGSQYQLQQPPFLTFDAGETFVDIVGIGNTLVITSDKKFYYILWKDDSYTLLGNSIPKLNIAFALDGEVLKHNYSDIKVVTSQTSVSTSNEEWQGVYSKSNISFSNLTHYTYSQYYYLPDSLELDANTDYRVSAFVPGTVPHIKLEGKNQNDEYEVLRNYIYRTKNKENAPKFKTTKAYTDLRICVYSNDYDYISVSIEIEKGVTQSVSIGRTVEKTQENLDALVGALNHFTKKYATDKERFIHPFFVRYAVRLYDESYAQISSPILMIPNSGYVPLLHLNYNVDHEETLTAYAFVANLQYALINSFNNDWGDIVSGVDVFISEPIYPYNQGVVLDKTDERMFVYKTRNYDTNEFLNIDKGHLSLSEGAYINDNYSVKDLYNIIRQTFDFGQYVFDTNQNASPDVSSSAQHIVVQVSPYTNNEIIDKVASVQNFYLIHSFSTADIKDGNRQFKTIPLKDGSLNVDSLVNMKRLDDNLLSYRTFLTGKLFDYNNRLHSYNVKYALPTPMAIDLQNNSHEIAEYINLVNDMYVYLHTSEGDKVVRGKYSSVLLTNSNYNGGFLPWFYYPDSRAYKAKFYKMDANQQNLLWFEIELKPHDFLSGAYYIAPTLDGEIGDMWLQETPPTINNTIQDVNSVYVSEVENPFLFVDKYTTKVGCKEIFALSTAAKALSQGQFGQFPLYAFTDTGVWALEVSNTGSYVARQPITRDVCLSAGSITQLDNAVIFATDRGIMLLSGSESTCLTDILMSDTVFDVTSLQGLQNVYDGDIFTPVPFRQFIADCRMLYDYTHQRIIVYNKVKDYAYVYSLKSKEWGMMPSDIKLGVNSYPECLAIDRSNKVLNFSAVVDNSVSPTSVKGLLVTRPLKLDTPNALKTIQTIIQRGKFRKGNVKTILYGSRDLYNWLVVRSSSDHSLRGFSGTPYKYFRIVLLCDLLPDESIYGCTIQYEPKQINKLR